jgi:hypothetical protein
MNKIALGVSLLALSAGSVFAQTCATPLPITSGGTPNGTVSGNTCTASNSLPGYGGTPSPQNEIVYSFVAQGANATIAIAETGAAFGAGIFLMPSPCSVATDVTALGFPGTPMAVNGLTNGQTYYVIVTADPGGPANACGPFTATVTGPLPVELQNFSVD